MVPSDNSPITTMAQQIQLAVTGVTGYSPICDSLECCCWTTFFETTFLVCKNIIPTLQETPWIKSVNYLDSLYFGRFGREIFDIPDIFFSPLPFSFALNKPAHPPPPLLVVKKGAVIIQNWPSLWFQRFLFGIPVIMTDYWMITFMNLIIQLTKKRMNTHSAFACHLIIMKAIISS